MNHSTGESGRAQYVGRVASAPYSLLGSSTSKITSRGHRLDIPVHNWCFFLYSSDVACTSHVRPFAPRSLIRSHCHSLSSRGTTLSAKTGVTILGPIGLWQLLTMKAPAGNLINSLLVSFWRMGRSSSLIVQLSQKEQQRIPGPFYAAPNREASGAGRSATRGPGINRLL
jgi:hypothetical protein